MNLRLLLIFSAICIVFSSCRMIQPTSMFRTEKDFQYKEFSESQRVMVLQPYDMLDIRMSTNNGQDLLETYTATATNYGYNNAGYNTLAYMIRQDSTVKLPTVGDVKLGGMVKDSAELLLETLLGEYYQSPFVRITVTNRHVIVFYNNGTTGKKIEIPETGLTLIEALSDGLPEGSRAYRIKLIRGNNKNPEVYNYNIRTLEEYKKMNLMLEANDILYVDSRPRYANKLVNEISVYLSLVTCITMVFTLFKK